MNVRELIERLSEYSGDMAVLVSVEPVSYWDDSDAPDNDELNFYEVGGLRLNQLHAVPPHVEIEALL